LKESYNADSTAIVVTIAMNFFVVKMAARWRIVYMIPRTFELGVIVPENTPLHHTMASWLSGVGVDGLAKSHGRHGFPRAHPGRVVIKVPLIHLGHHAFLEGIVTQVPT